VNACEAQRVEEFLDMYAGVLNALFDMEYRVPKDTICAYVNIAWASLLTLCFLFLGKSSSWA
jgi:hypothetical protein